MDPVRSPEPDPAARAPTADALEAAWDAGLAVAFAGDADEAGGELDGRYRLVERLGEGGMGTVWAARQTAPLRRDVAVKLIKVGMDSRMVLARFEAERQALALMDHPHIAKVLDAGTTPRGRPYFVMELVRGAPVTAFCDERGLTPRERLALFVPVCQAIQHAHQKGIIHRDIKPSNVLVEVHDGRPVPKVIDFGVAKSVGPPLTERTLATGLGGVVGTPQYMSPEQAALDDPDIDTRSDVYALGAVLYELLAGAPPFARPGSTAGGVLETLRAVREQDPPRPSAKLSTADGLPALAARRGTEPRRLAALVRGELDWIVMKSLEKDRARRYDSAAALADDVRRYLSGEPVQAAPPSAAYRVRKLLRRNRGPVAAAAVVVLALVLGLAGTGWGLVEARRQRDAAEASAGRAEAKTREAEEASRRLAERAYVADVRQVRLALEEGRPGFLRELLDAHRPAPGAADLRGFEWHYWDRLATPALRSPPVGDLFSVAVAPDGTQAVAGTARGAVVWDLRTGHEVLTFTGHRRPVWHVACGPSGLALTGSADGTAVLWDARDGTALKTYPGANGMTRAVAFSGDGRRYAIANENEAVVYDTRTRAAVARRPFSQPVHHVALDAGGTRLAVGGGRGATVVFDTAGAVVAQVEAHGAGAAELRGLAFSPDGRRLVTGSTVGGVRVWSLGAALDPVQMVGTGSSAAPSAAVTRVAFLPDGAGIVATATDGMLRHWDAASGELVRAVPAHEISSPGVAVAPDGRVVTASFGGTLAVWDGTGWRGRLTGHRSQVTGVAVAPGGDLFASSGGVWDPTGAGRYAGGELLVWDARTVRLRHDLVRGGSGVTCAAFSPDGRLLAAGTGAWDAARGCYTGGVVTLWNPATGAAVGRLEGHGSSVLCVAFSPDGRKLVSGGFDGTTIVWDVADRAAEWTIPAPGRDVRAVAFSPDGRSLAVGGDEGPDADPLVRVYDLGTRAPRTWRFDATVSGLAFSPDGRRLAATGYAAASVVFDACTGDRLFALQGHAGSPTAVAFSPDGTRIATASEDKTVRVWLAKDGQEVLALKGHTGVVRGVAFTPDGRKLVSGAWDATVRVWDATPLPESSPPDRR